MMKIKQILLGSVTSLGLFSASSPALAATDLVNFLTSDAGMHRITYQELVDQGVDLAGINHRRFGLSLNGQVIAMHTKGQENQRGVFGPGGYIEFYADSSDSLYTEQQAYTLKLLTRTERQLRKSFTVNRAKLDRTAPMATSYKHTEIIEENNFYDTIAPSATDPYHYGQTISLLPTTPVYNFELDKVVGDSKATVAVEMYGLLDFAIAGNDHDYAALINGVEIGNQQFDGATVDTLVAENVAVNNGRNTVQYQYRPVAGVAFDRIALNRVLVTYERQSEARNGYLQGEFSAPQARVTGLGSEAANVYRKDDTGIVRITGAKKDGNATAFNTGGIVGDYIVVADNAFKRVEVAAIADEQNITSGDAEYLIIAHPSLMGDTLNELVQIRQTEYSVKVVDVNQVFAQFGNHLPSATSIRDYVRHAVDNMATKMVLIVGSDTYDYKNRKTNSVSLVPTMYVTTPAGVVTVTQTPSDAIYGDTDGDLIPDVPVGRISARTTTELANVVEKIRDYAAREGYVGRVLIAADKDDNGTGISFKEDAEDLIAAMPDEWAGSIRSDYRAYPDVDGAQQAKDKLKAAIEAGVSVVSYIGHSSQQSWSYATPPLLTASEVSNFNNLDKPTVVTQWGCWNTYFVDPGGNSIADQFLLASQAGAVVVLGASTLTSANEERALGVELNKRLYNRGITIGDAVIQAKQALAKELTAPAIQLGYQIIGDPAVRVAQ